MRLASDIGIPVGETQAGRGALAWDHPMALGSIGVTGTSAANRAAEAADLVIGVGTRLQDFTTGSRALFGAARLAQINVAPFDAAKHGALSVVGDARVTLEALRSKIGGHRTPEIWTQTAQASVETWNRDWDVATAAPSDTALPSDAQVIGAVQAAPCRRQRRGGLRRRRGPAGGAAQAVAAEAAGRLPPGIWLFLHGL